MFYKFNSDGMCLLLIGCPVTLSPAELVVKLGDPASVNCSTSVADPAKLGWEAPVGGSGFEGITSITWDVDKVQFWKIAPMCYITTRDNEQCSVSLALTVYSEYMSTTHYPLSLSYNMFDDVKVTMLLLLWATTWVWI